MKSKEKEYDFAVNEIKTTKGNLDIMTVEKQKLSLKVESLQINDGILQSQVKSKEKELIKQKQIQEAIETKIA